MNDTSQFWQDLKSGRFASMVKESAKGKRLSNSQEAYNVLKPMVAIIKEAVMQRQLNESVNIAIMDNEKSAHDWRLNDLAWELYWWVDFFNIAFFINQPVPVPVISFERTKVTNLGHYVIGRNAFGIKENININSAHLNRPLWDILATLLHEITHTGRRCMANRQTAGFTTKNSNLKCGNLELSATTREATRQPETHSSSC